VESGGWEPRPKAKPNLGVGESKAFARKPTGIGGIRETRRRQGPLRLTESDRALDFIGQMD
jgi:hypothetical protein